LIILYCSGCINLHLHPDIHTECRPGAENPPPLSYKRLMTEAIVYENFKFLPLELVKMIAQY
jgi:hypothetical protein